MGDRAGIGILLTDNVKIHTKIPVKVNPGQLGGPSGGLMFSLQIYQQVSGEDLRHGRKIAGTGTIAQMARLARLAVSIKSHCRSQGWSNDLFAPYVKPTKTILKYEEGHKTNYQLAKETAKMHRGWK